MCQAEVKLELFGSSTSRCKKTFFKICHMGHSIYLNKGSDLKKKRSFIGPVGSI